MAPGQTAGAEASWEALRDQAVRDLDEFIESAIETRKSLRTFQAALEKNRRHLARGGRASEMSTLFDLPSLRASLTDWLTEIERTRAAARVSLWRLLLAEGMTIAEVGRICGVSRQLVSRTLAATTRSAAKR